MSDVGFGMASLWDVRCELGLMSDGFHVGCWMIALMNVRSYMGLMWDGFDMGR